MIPSIDDAVYKEKRVGIVGNDRNCGTYKKKNNVFIIKGTGVCNGLHSIQILLILSELGNDL